MGLKDGPTSQENSATGFLQDILSFFGEGEGSAKDQLSFASDLQRNIGESLNKLFANDGNAFDVTPAAKALEEGQAIDRERGAQTIQEQFGAAGTRFGTPIAGGTSRFLQEIIPRQEAVLQDLFFRSHEGAQNRLLAGSQAGTQLGSSIVNPILSLAALGREDTAGEAGAISTVGGFIDNIIPG